MRKLEHLTGACLLCGLLLAAVGCGGGETAPLYKPALLFKFPDKYNSPDGMSIGKDGYIYLSMNNKNLEFKYPAKIMRISPDDKYEEFSDLPNHPDTGKVSPLGNGWASDGNFYIADNQMFCTDKRGVSRVLRVNVKDGKAAGVDAVATGLNMSNGLACWGDCVYVCDSTLGTETPMPSGVYRFKISELKAGAPVAVKGVDDPHMFFKFMTQSPQHHVGANGLDFDSKGVMYVCNFGDAEVIKVTLDKDGNVASSKLLAKDNGMESTDGLHADEQGNLWVADFLGNAIFKINSETGAVVMIAKNANCDGANGELHAPSEAIRRGNKLYISNIDITYGPNVRHDNHTMSLIELKE
ncbi:MAG: SMP-30/gluconolactonase/LRE family protein [Planctomycetota bacterium]